MSSVLWIACCFELQSSIVWSRHPPLSLSFSRTLFYRDLPPWRVHLQPGAFLTRKPVAGAIIRPSFFLSSLFCLLQIPRGVGLWPPPPGAYSSMIPRIGCSPIDVFNALPCLPKAFCSTARVFYLVLLSPCGRELSLIPLGRVGSQFPGSDHSTEWDRDLRDPSWVETS